MVNAFNETLAAIIHHPLAPTLDGANEVILDDIDLDTNPQRFPNDPSDTAHYWLCKDGSLKQVVFAGIITFDGQGDKSGPYFNLPPPSRSPSATADNLAKLRSGFNFGLVHEEDITPDGTKYPEWFLQHQRTILIALLTIEEAANRIFDKNVQPTTPRPRSMGFVKKDHARNRWIISTVTNLLFPGAQKITSSSVSLNDFRRGISLSPRKHAANPRAAGAGPQSINSWTLSDLPDPASRYKAAADADILKGARIDVPLVYDTDGSLIHPAKYREKIEDGALAVVHGILKVYNITNDDRGSSSRPFQILIQKMQILPPLDVKRSPFFATKKRGTRDDDDVFQAPSGNAVSGSSAPALKRVRVVSKV